MKFHEIYPFSSCRNVVQSFVVIFGDGVLFGSIVEFFRVVLSSKDLLLPHRGDDIRSADRLVEGDVGLDVQRIVRSEIQRRAADRAPRTLPFRPHHFRETLERSFSNGTGTGIPQDLQNLKVVLVCSDADFSCKKS